jgi:RNA-binding protein 25
VLLEYSAEEMASVADQLRERERREAEEARAIIDSIPTDAALLYAEPVDWDLLARARVLERKLRPWVAQKVTEYLGTEEADLIAFVLAELAQRPVHAAVVERLRPVMEGEAQMFVLKLWRKLIFEQRLLQRQVARGMPIDHL